MTERVNLPRISGDLTPWVGFDRLWTQATTQNTLTGIFVSLEGAPSGGPVTIEYRDADLGLGNLLATVTVTDGASSGSWTGAVAVAAGTTIWQRITAANSALGLGGYGEFNLPVGMTSLDRVKEKAGITSTDSDGLILSLIAGVSEAMAAYCSRRFVPEARTDVVTVSSPQSQRIQVPYWPVLSVDRLEDREGGVIDPGDYEVELATGRIFPTNGATWARGYRRYEVDAVSGYDPIPFELVEAATDQTVFELRHSNAKDGGMNRLGLESKVQQEGGTTSYLTSGWLPSVEQRLEPYRLRLS